MGQKINILHLSDIHFGAEPTLTVTSTAIAKRNNVIVPLINHLSEIETEWKPQIIVISGDIGWKGLDSDYEQAKEWIEKLLHTLRLDKSDLILCAGNHDLNRKKAKGLVRSSSSQEADDLLEIENLENFIRPFEGFNRFCETFGISPLFIGPEVQNQFLYGCRELKGLRFIVLNSSWFCRDDNDKAKLWLGLPQIKVLNSYSQLVDPQNYNNGTITISVFHHPKEWFKDEEFRCWNNRKATYSYLMERCHITLTGHVHSTIPEPNRESNGAWVFTGGTTYSGDEYYNSFQIIQIDIEDRTAIRRVYELDPRNDRWKMTLGKSDYPLTIGISPLNRNIQIQSDISVMKYNYNLLVNKAKAHAQRYVEQKSRAIARSLTLPALIERKVAVHNREERVARTSDNMLY